MKVSFNWLSEYVRAASTPEQLAERLTMAGIEVESITKLNAIPTGIVVAEILERKPHPNADKLSVCAVSNGKERFQIVCGAPNCDAGQKVPLATLGTVFEDKDGGKPFTIATRALRGVESSGMLCSSKELGLDGDHSGLMILPPDAPLGEPLAALLKPDTVYEVEITPNRPDCLSHWGVAREVAALAREPARFPEIRLPAHAGSRAGFEAAVEVLNPDLCPRYTARVIKGVKVTESPAWLKEHLASVGLRPINNIVDITNFVLLELGQPLHAFDLALLSDRKVIVRTARPGEKLLTLDGKTHELKTDQLVIADAEKPVALAGVMGGEHSGVVASTVDVLLESAYFNPASVRSTSRALGISSDSSYRFERGVDIGMVDRASDRATALIVELAGGEIASDLIDVRAPFPAPKPITCVFNHLRSLLGITITNEAIADIFTRLGLDVSSVTTEACVVQPPSHRTDLVCGADLAEEVARINGLAAIPVVAISSNSGGSAKNDSYYPLEAARGEFAAIGLQECMTYSMIDPKAAAPDMRFVKEDFLAMSNPISTEQGIMRPSLLYGMLASVGHNISRNCHDLALFEIGKAFSGDTSKRPEERWKCCVALTGRQHPERFSAEKSELYDFYDMKGLFETWLGARRIRDVVCRKTTNPVFGANAAEFVVDGQAVAWFGEPIPAFTKGLRLRNPLLIALVELEQFFHLKGIELRYKPFSLFPEVTRDVAVAAPGTMENAVIIDFIKNCGCANLENVELFDLFPLNDGRKSLAYTLTFRHPERTLTDAEVNTAHESVRKRLVKDLGVELR